VRIVLTSSNVMPFFQFVSVFLM